LCRRRFLRMVTKLRLRHKGARTPQRGWRRGMERGYFIMQSPAQSLKALGDGTVMLLDEEIEIINLQLPRGRFRFALFDFDGTLSLIREGWPQVMIPMMVGVLRQTGTDETEPELAAKVDEFVMRLNGKQTIYQM